MSDTPLRGGEFASQFTGGEFGPDGNRLPKEADAKEQPDNVIDFAEARERLRPTEQPFAPEEENAGASSRFFGGAPSSEQAAPNKEVVAEKTEAEPTVEQQRKLTPEEKFNLINEIKAEQGSLEPSLSSLLKYREKALKLDANSPTLEKALSIQLQNQLLAESFRLDVEDGPEAAENLNQLLDVLESYTKSGGLDGESVAKLDKVMFEAASHEHAQLTDDHIKRIGEIWVERHGDDENWDALYDKLSATQMAGIGARVGLGNATVPNRPTEVEKVLHEAESVSVETDTVENTEEKQDEAPAPVPAETPAPEAEEQSQVPQPEAPEVAAPPTHEASENQDVLRQITEQNQANYALASEVQKEWDTTPAAVRNGRIDLQPLSRVGGDVNKFMQNLEKTMNRTTSGESRFGGLSGEGLDVELKRKQKIGEELEAMIKHIEAAQLTSTEHQDAVEDASLLKGESLKRREKFEAKQAEIADKEAKLIQENPSLGDVLDDVEPLVGRFKRARAKVRKVKRKFRR